MKRFGFPFLILQYVNKTTASFKVLQKENLVWNLVPRNVAFSSKKNGSRSCPRRPEPFFEGNATLCSA